MKAYVKPELFYERYELSQHIATCGIDVNHDDENSCSPLLDGDFWPGLGGTVVLQEGCGVQPEVYCYTTGTDVQGRLFNS